MKTKNFRNKLTLNKVTVADLEKNAQDAIMGGVIYVTTPVTNCQTVGAMLTCQMFTCASGEPKCDQGDLCQHPTIATEYPDTTYN